MIFEQSLRLGSSGDVIRKSPGEIDSTNEDDSSPHKRRRSSVNVNIYLPIIVYQ